MERKELRQIHKAADYYEGQMRARFERAVKRMQDQVSLYELGNAIAAKDVKGAMKLIEKQMVQEALSPVGTIAKQAFVKGGKVGAEQVVSARR